MAGGDPVEVEVVETDRGPVVVGGPDEPGAVSLRYPPRVTGDLGFAALPALLRARSVADVDTAVDRWVEPVNVVLAADTAGGLLHRVAGAVPVRHPDNRLRIVPAWAPEHAWQGWHVPLPRAEVSGVAVMANERGVSAPLGVEFAPPHRATRIRELLGASTGWTAERMGTVHTDTYLAPAEPLLALLADLGGLAPDAAALRDRLLHWDRRMAADSVAAGAFAAIRSALVRRIAAHPALAGLAEPPPYPEVFRPWLALLPRVGAALTTLLTPGALPGLGPVALVRAALVEVADSDLAGGERGDATGAGHSARWGARHRLAPWQALPDPPPPAAGGGPDSRPDSGPATGGRPASGLDSGRDAGGGPELAGDHDCVLATSSVPGVTDRCLRGPAARYVWDLARRADSRWVVPLGAAGVTADPHHHDQQPYWVRGDLLPVLTDWDELTEERDD